MICTCGDCNPVLQYCACTCGTALCQHRTACTAWCWACGGMHCGRQRRYQDLVDDEEHDRLLKALVVLEKKDQMAQRMEAVTK